MYVAPTKIRFSKQELDSAGFRLPGSFYVSYADVTRGEINLDFAYDTSYESLVDRLKEKDKEEKLSRSYQLVEDPFLTSDEIKYVFRLDQPYGHFITDTICRIFRLHKSNPSAALVIIVDLVNPYDYQQSETDKQLKFLEMLLQKNSVRYTLIMNRDRHNPQGGSTEVYRFNNAVFFSGEEYSVNISLLNVTKLLEEYVLGSILDSRGGSRKLYLSRGALKQPANPFRKDTAELEPGEFRYEDNVRIYDEKLVEDYLSSKGFEIFKSEEFESLEDQIRYINTASLVVAVSGSALVNVLFMESNKTVIELKVEDMYKPYDGADFSYSTFMEYVNHSYAKGHTHIGVDLYNKQGSTAVEKLENLFAALDVDKLV